MNGIYYLFDSTNKNRLFPASWFRNEKQAIEIAKKDEIGLIQVQYKNNIIEWTKVLYDPFLFYNNVSK